MIWTKENIEIMRDMYNSFIPLDDIAKHFGVKKNTFRTVFHSKVGGAKHRYAKHPELYPGWEPVKKFAFLYKKIIESIKNKNDSESEFILKHLPHKFVEKNY